MVLTGRTGHSVSMKEQLLLWFKLQYLNNKYFV